MFLLNKKRIILFVLVIFVSMLVYFIGFYNGNDKHSVLAANSGINNKTIVIDARTSENQMKVR